MPDPNANGSQCDRCEEVSSELVVTRGDASDMLEFIEEPLDEIALAVEFRIDRADDFDVALRRDVRSRAAACEELDDRACAVAAIGDGLTGRPQAIDQRRQCRLVGGLAGRQEETDRQAIGIDDGMDLGGQSSTRKADGVIRAPFFPPAAC